MTAQEETRDALWKAEKKAEEAKQDAETEARAEKRADKIAQYLTTRSKLTENQPQGGTR